MLRDRKKLLFHLRTVKNIFAAQSALKMLHNFQFLSFFFAFYSSEGLFNVQQLNIWEKCVLIMGKYGSTSYIIKKKSVLVLHFSYQCITRSLEESNRCPKCNYIIDKPDQIFPNFLRKYNLHVY